MLHRDVRGSGPVAASRIQKLKIPGGPVIEPLELVNVCVQVAQDKKARDIKILDVRRSLAIADYFVIATGENRRQIQAMAAEIERTMKEGRQRKPGVEGAAAARWVLIDLDTVIMHVFDPETRGIYSLEHLWADAPAVDPSALVAEHARHQSEAAL